MTVIRFLLIAMFCAGTFFAGLVAFLLIDWASLHLKLPFIVTAAAVGGLVVLVVMTARGVR